MKFSAKFFAIFLPCLLILLAIAGQVSSTFAQPEGPCPSFESRLAIGEPARITPGAANNVRDWPSTSSNKTGSIPGGEEIQVLAGPSCDDEITWWFVNYNHEVIGWTGEGDSHGYWAEPITESSENYISFPEDVLPGLALIPGGGGEDDCVSIPIYTWPEEDLDSFSYIACVAKPFEVAGFAPMEQVIIILESYTVVPLKLNASSQGIVSMDCGVCRLILAVGEEGHIILRTDYKTQLWSSIGFNPPPESILAVLYSIFWEGETVDWADAGCPNEAPIRLRQYSDTRVMKANQKIFEQPTISANTIATVPIHSVLTIGQGVSCGDNAVWWAVEYEGDSGYIMENQGNTYFLEPMEQ